MRLPSCLFCQAGGGKKEKDKQDHLLSTAKTFGGITKSMLSYHLATSLRSYFAETDTSSRVYLRPPLSSRQVPQCTVEGSHIFAARRQTQQYLHTVLRQNV